MTTKEALETVLALAEFMVPLDEEDEKAMEIVRRMLEDN